MQEWKERYAASSFSMRKTLLYVCLVYDGDSNFFLTKFSARHDVKIVQLFREAHYAESEMKNIFFAIPAPVPMDDSALSAQGIARNHFLRANGEMLPPAPKTKTCYGSGDILSKIYPVIPSHTQSYLLPLACISVTSGAHSRLVFCRVSC